MNAAVLSIVAGTLIGIADPFPTGEIDPNALRAGEVVWFSWRWSKPPHSWRRQAVVVPAGQHGFRVFDKQCKWHLEWPDEQGGTSWTSLDRGDVKVYRTEK